VRVKARKPRPAAPITRRIHQTQPGGPLIITLGSGKRLSKLSALVASGVATAASLAGLGSAAGVAGVGVLAGASAGFSAGFASAGGVVTAGGGV